jgi:hypothetical protein
VTGSRATLARVAIAAIRAASASVGALRGSRPFLAGRWSSISAETAALPAPAGA